MARSDRRFGVRGRLLAAFLGISALFLLGAIAALLTFAETGTVFDRVTRERVPSTLAALELSRSAERLALIAPRIVADETVIEQLRTDRMVRRQLASLDTQFAKVKANPTDSALVAEIETSVLEIRQNLASLQTFREPWARSTLDRPTSSAGTIDPVARGVLVPPSREEMLAEGQKMIQANIAAADRLASAVDRLVARERAEITKAEADVAAAQRTSSLVLLGTVILSLAGSGLIVWLYVSRNIVRRLTELSTSMQAIAGGNLTAPLPDDTDTDEVAQMSDALRIFRDKAIENQRLQRLKGFLAPQVAELIVSSGDESILDSHRRDVVVVFCDLRGFTAFAEMAEPEEVMEFLRHYHQKLGQLVDKFGGTLERFTGDGLIVLFNDPLPVTDPCLIAARLAVEMRAGVEVVINRSTRLRDRLGFGVGMAYGYATLGRIGSQGRFEYTAIGSVVNLAARLCERASNNQILVDGAVKGAIEGHLPTEDLGEFTPRGLSRPVRVYNILAEDMR
ncbi:MAG: HAMP domain-containing protein [Rhizobiales bacterium]|nr:HAMP domain-containing protein [Hyphomicrobiales bacterium]